MELNEIIEQLEKCAFRDEIGHPIENNTAFVELKRMIETGWLKILCPECKCGANRGILGEPKARVCTECGERLQ